MDSEVELEVEASCYSARRCGNTLLAQTLARHPQRRPSRSADVTGADRGLATLGEDVEEEHPAQADPGGLLLHQEGRDGVIIDIDEVDKIVAQGGEPVDHA